MMSLSPPEPLDALRADVEGAVRRRWRDVRWWLRKFVGAQLVKLLLGGAASIALLLAALPFFAAATAAVVVGAAVGYAVYARKQLVDERTMRRWAFVQGKRMQQDVLTRYLPPWMWERSGCVSTARARGAWRRGRLGCSRPACGGLGGG